MAAKRLVFITQQVDPDHPVLAATVQQVAALAARVDELVVLADGVVSAALPANCRFRTFASGTRLGRGLRFEAVLARELRPRPVAVVAHMVPLYAVLAAPLVRPLRIPLAFWFTHWKPNPTRRFRLADRVCTVALSVDRRTYPVTSRKLRPIGHGIAVDEFPCAERAGSDRLRALALGRTSPSKGVDRILRAIGLARAAGVDVEIDVYGPSLTEEERLHRRDLEALAATLDGAARVHDPVPRSEVPRLLARSDCLVNNTPAADKAVYEAAASCLPVLASNEALEDILGGLDLAFPPDDEQALAARIEQLAVLPASERSRIGAILHERVVAGHSVDAWADKLLAAVS